MTLPMDLVLARHGQSKENKVLSALMSGKVDKIPDSYLDFPSTVWPLTDLGKDQARQTGAWLKAEFADGFDAYFVSSLIRAIQSASLLGLDVRDWCITSLLDERSWGDFNHLPKKQMLVQERRRRACPFYWRPPNAVPCSEHIQTHIHVMLDLLSREYSDKRVLMVGHGESMMMFRCVLEHWTPWEFDEHCRSKSKANVILNGHVLHYTRRVPDGSGEVTGEYRWMRSLCPSQPDGCSTQWIQIPPPKRLDNDDLLDIVTRYSKLFD